MKLRLRRADRATEHSGNLLMLVSFYIVQREDRAVAGRQLRYRFIKGDAVNDRHGVRVLRSLDDLHGGFAILGRLLHLHPALAKVHQDLIDRQAMQPRRKSRLATKAAYFAKELDEDLLREVFGLRDVLRHAKAERINATVMTLVKLLEGLHIAFCCSLRQRVVRALRFLGFGCGHLSLVHALGSRRLWSVSYFQHATRGNRSTGQSRSPDCQRKALSAFPRLVMRRFRRVVALFR